MKSRYILIALIAILTFFSLLTRVQAVESPPPGALVYVQTNGPTAAITLGDWYTSTANGVGSGYHYFQVNIPCGWPAATPVHFDLFSPEMNSNNALADEVGGGGPLNTQFEIYGPGTVIVSPNLPAPGTSTLPNVPLPNQQTYVPSAVAEQWIRFYTVPTVTAANCGNYVVRAQASAGDQNAWRLRVGTDNDAIANNVPPANYDNPDGVAGTGDEITIGITQTSYQHDVAAAGVGQCLTLFEYVAPSQASVAFHNFDMDGNLRVRYYSPVDVFDPLGAAGGTVGTISGNGIWNTGTAINRGTGDVINNPIPGWWRIVTCVGNHNQYIQEGQLNNPAFYTQPPTPRMTVTKDDGLTVTSPGQTLTYTLTFANVSNTDPAPGAAFNVVIRDTIPANAAYVPGSCALNAPYTGTCAFAAGVVTYTITGGPLPNAAVAAGATGTVTLQVAVNAGAVGTVVNNVTLDYNDMLGNVYPQVTGTDTDTIVPPTADLSITKTDGVTTYTPGTTTTYTIVVNNAGPNDVTGATVADTFPAQIASASWTCVATGTATCTAGPVAGNINDTVNINAGAGNFLTYTVTANIAPAAAGNLVNTATVTLPAGITDPTPANNSATDTDTLVAASADLSITKTDGSATYSAGGTTTYTIVVNNAGPNNVTGATVADTFPAQIASASWTCVATGTATCTAGPVAGNISDTVNINAGAGNFLTYTVTANIAPAAAGNLVNTATVTVPAGVTDPTPGNNTATDTDTLLPPSADLSITKDDGVTTYTPGGAVSYAIIVHNAGPNNVTGATVADTFPAQIASASWTCVATGTATCTAGPVAGNINDTVNINAGPGNFLTYTVTANIAPAAAGNLVNTATVTEPAGVTDPTPGNNTATDTDTVTPNADLSITKDDGVATYTPGSTTTYTIVVRNAGPSNVIGATVADTFPAQIASASWTCVATGIATCTAGPVVGNINDTVNIAAGGGNFLTYTVTANIAPAAAGNLVNTATVTAPAGVTDPTPANNTDTDTDTLVPPSADLSITKDDGVTTYTPGTTTTYSIVVRNAGPNNVTGATVADTFPAQIASASWTCVATGIATCTAGPVAGNINDTVNINAGAGNFLTYTVTANIAAAATGNLVNTATVTEPAGVTDPTPANNTATDTDTPPGALSADLSITKDDGVTTYTPSGTVTYAIVVHNLGPNNVTAATVADVFPAQIASASWTCVVTGTAKCTAGPVVGNINDTVDINAGAGNFLTYTVTANIAAAATGNLVNTATVTPPAGVTDPTPANNTATDTDTPPGALSADLSITKDDGVITYTPGGTLNYTIVVNNAGLNNVTGATVADVFPAQIASASWTCIATGTANCTAGPVAGNINDTVNINAGPGNFLTYVVTANIAPAATGNLVNIATVTPPAGVTDPTPANNTATDIDVPPGGSAADLSITKDDGVTIYTPRGTVTYTIVVHNLGPSSVTAATVADVFPAQIASASWTCIATGTATCTAGPVTGNINDTVNINAGPGNFLTYTVTANIAPTATGNLVNTATVTPPAGITDPTPGNNTATDTDTLPGGPAADLSITKTDNVATYTPGSTLTYTIVVRNAGPSNVTGATVADVFPSQIASASWTCVATGTATCTAGPLAGNINDTVNINAGAGNFLTYTVTATISATASGNLVNTATVTPPAGIVDPTPANNSAIDTDTLPGGGGGPTAVPGATPNPQLADPVIVKLVDPSLARPGENVTFTITVTNRGTAPAINLVVNDSIPSVLQIVSANTSQGNFALNGNAYTFYIGTVNPGQVITLHIIAKIRPDVQTPVDVTNTATLNDRSASATLHITRGDLPGTGEHPDDAPSPLLPAIVLLLVTVVGVAVIGKIVVVTRRS